MRRDWYVFPRRKIWYAQFRNPDSGELLVPRSTGARTRDEAIFTVGAWLKEGLPEGKTSMRRPLDAFARRDVLLRFIASDNCTPDDLAKIATALINRGFDLRPAGEETTPINLCDYFTNFWTYDTSFFVREQLAHGHSLTRRHCSDCLAHINNYWRPKFGDMRLQQVETRHLREFALELKTEKKLAAATCTLIMNAGTRPLRWAHARGELQKDPTQGLLRFSGSPTKRGILTPEEAAGVFRSEWSDDRSRVANLLAMTSGLRAGEILALKPDDIGNDRVFVRHSWSPYDGLKAPKNGQARVSVLLPLVRDELLGLIRKNPHPDRQFVFFGSLAHKPMDKNILTTGLHRALAAIGIDEPMRRVRSLSFQSWRHQFSTSLANVVGQRTMKLTGHMDETTFETYADHASEVEFRALAVATSQTFQPLLDSETTFRPRSHLQ